MKDSDWEILYELYKNPNMTKVANMLYITQPSLTKRLQHMEAEFQVAIVNRTPKGLEFTAEGEFLAKQAKAYLEFIQDTRKKLESYKQTVEGSIRIGSSYTYSKYTLSDILVPFTMKHPEVHFDIITDQSNVLFRKMLDGSIDVAFIRGNYEGAVNKVLIGSNEAYLVTKEPVQIEDLPNMQKINYKTNDRTKELLDAWWENRVQKELPSGMEVGYIDFAWQLINKGMGYTVCFLPDNFANEYNLCLTPLENSDGSRVIRNTWFLYPQSKRISGVMEQFVRYIEKEVSMKNRP